MTVVAGTYDGAVAREEPAPNLTLHRMGSRLTVFPRAAYACLRRGIARDADVVLEVVNGITFLTPLWLRRPRVALVHHIHRDHYVAELGRPGAIAALVAETLPLQLLYRDTTFLTISEAGRHDLVELGLPEERIHVAYLGVEPPPFEASERSAAPRLLYLGRLKRYKGVHHVIRAFAAMGHSTATLEIAGAGDYRAALERLAASLDLGDRVRFLGRVSEQEKLSLLRRAWALVFASPKEGWGITNLEAAACGTPVVASNSPGIRESVRDGDTGYLVPHGDVRAMAAAMGRLAVDRSLVERLGAQARGFAETFTWERAAEETERHLERVLATGR